MANGEVTPETALEVMPLAQIAKPVYNASKEAANLVAKTPKEDTNIFLQELAGFNGENGVIHLSDKPYLDPFAMHSSRAKIKGYDPSKVKLINVDEPSWELGSYVSDLATKSGLTPSEAHWLLQARLKDLGNAAAEIGNNIILYNNTLPKSNYSTIFSHELEHALHAPSTPLPDGIMDSNFLNLYDGYFRINNNTDIAARGSQIRDWLGQTGTEPLTMMDLQRASENYVKDVGIDNNMTEFFNAIRDYKGLAKWLSKEATGVVPATIIGDKLHKSKQK